MRSRTLIICISALTFMTGSSAYAQSTTFVNPQGNGGFTINGPSGPGTVTPQGYGGGYAISSPGGNSLVTPQSNGGYSINSSPPDYCVTHGSAV
jgi:hypothetical protein